MEFDIKDLEWKPILSKEMTLYDRVGRLFKAHPIMIFEHEDKVYFLKAVSAKYFYDENNNLIFSKYQKEDISNSEAYLIKPYDDQPFIENYKTYFQKTSIIDTAQIFAMNKNEFIEYFGYDNLLKADYFTRKIRYQDRFEVLDQLKTNFSKKNISITLISKKDGKEFEPKLIYSSQKFIDRSENAAIKDFNDGKNVNFKKIEEYKSEYNKYKNLHSNDIDKQIDTIKLIVDSYYEEERNRLLDISEEVGDLALLSALNNEVKKYSEYTVETRWNTDMDLLDKKYNISKYEHEYYCKHKEEYNEKFKTLYEELEEDINLKEQKETKKKDKDQEMTL